MMKARIGRAVREAFMLQRVDLAGIAPSIRWDAVGEAVLREMREPTDAMVLTGVGAAPGGYIVAAHALYAWRAMIDEALK